MSTPPNHNGASPSQESRPKVIYVMGAGRSGTTILGIALGNCSDYLFAGELNQWLTKSGVPSYGDPERERFWAAVREEVDGAEELFGGKTTCLERSSALVDVRKWGARRRLRGPYRRLSENLYLAVARTAGVTHIVDSSHYPLRARELRGLGGIDFYLLYVVRDAQGVLASLNKSDVPERSFNMPTTNAYLWLTHLMSVLVFLLHPRQRRMLVRHEDFLADPAAVLEQILEWTGSSSELPDFSSLGTGMPLHGNRLVASSTVSLKRGTAPEHTSRATSLLQAPWRAIHSRLRPVARAVEPSKHDADRADRARMDDA